MEVEAAKRREERATPWNMEELLERHALVMVGPAMLEAAGKAMVAVVMAVEEQRKRQVMDGSSRSLQPFDMEQQQRMM